MEIYNELFQDNNNFPQQYSGCSRHEKLDDTETISCTIETTQEINGHTEYVLRLQRGPPSLKHKSWSVHRRYNDFVALDRYFSKSGVILPLPGKRYIGNMRPEFIAERQQALQVYIDTILMNPILASSLPAKRFVDPDNYSQSFHDQAVQNALLCLRNEGNLWSLGGTMGAIGWRLRKHYFKVTPKHPSSSSSETKSGGGGKLLTKSGSTTVVVTTTTTTSSSGSRSITDTQANTGGGSSSSCSSSSSSTSSGGVQGHTTATTTTALGTLDFGRLQGSELILEWLEYGPDKYIEDKELTGILRSLTLLQHPFIEPILYATHNECGCLTIRKFHKQGTLKDILYMATPKNTFTSKYGNPKGRTALPMKKVALLGKQMLEALIYLHSKGYPYGHLHSGNVCVIEDSIRLLDVENYVLGVPSFYRPFFVQHSKIHSPEAIDVYSFGHVLFEMSMGYPLQESVIRQINDCPESLKNLLESILSREACKTGLPSLQQLLTHSFFLENANDYYSLTNHYHYQQQQQQEQQRRKEGGGGGGSGVCNPINLKPYFKLSLQAKELIKEASQKAEQRLRDEQKSVRNQKRLVRVQELMSSEEEKRKIKQKTKMEHKQQNRLRQQISLQTTNNNNNNGRLQASQSVPMPSSTTNSDQHPMMMTMTTTTTTSGRSSSTTEESRNRIMHSSGSIQNRTKMLRNLANIERQLSTPNILGDQVVEESMEEEEEPQREGDSNNGSNLSDRSALLESICRFNRGSLRKVRSND